MDIKLINRCLRAIRSLFSPFTRLYKSVVSKISKNIRLEIMVVFCICLLVSITTGNIAGRILQIQSDNYRIEHDKRMGKSNEPAMILSNDIERKKINIDNKLQIEQLLKAANNNQDYKIIICNVDGKVIYKTDNISETQVDINSTIKKSFDSYRQEQRPFRYGGGRKNYLSFYPVRFNDGDGYIIISGQQNETPFYDDFINIDIRLISSIITLLSFVIIFFLLTNKKMRYIEFVLDGLLEISKGNLNYKIKRQGEDELALLADNINFMADELKAKIEDERKADRIKNEIITNVSHDLRTPLTSIKGYLDIIKGKKYSEQKQLDQYINIVYNKAEKLEMLVNDLFEYTKLVNNAVSIERQDIVLNELLGQLIEEFAPACEDNNVTMTKDFIKEKVIINVDPNKTVRVFENLLINAIRYSIKPSDIKVSLRKDKDYTVVCIKNKCEPIDKKDLKRIFERFYRVEKSRSSDTGGSGLGLAIAKNMVEIQGGAIEVEYEDGFISFIVSFKL